MSAFLLAIWRTNRLLPLLTLLLLLANLAVFVWKSSWLSPELTVIERRYGELRAQSRPSSQEPASLQARLLQAEEDLRTFRQAIPQEADFTGLIEELFAAAAASGLELDRVGYAPKLDEEKKLLRYDLVFSVRGEYRQIKRFIHSLEQSSRIIAIEGVSLAGQESEAGEAVNLSIRLSTYFVADPS